MSFFTPIRGFPPELLAKRFALVSKRHSKKAKDVTNCNKMFWLCYKINSKWFSGKFSGTFIFFHLISRDLYRKN